MTLSNRAWPGQMTLLTEFRVSTGWDHVLAASGGMMLGNIYRVRQKSGKKILAGAMVFLS
jgi:hypothetical protein